MPQPLPVSAEFVAVFGFVLLSAFLTVELLRGPQSPARRALTAFTGIVLVNRVVYLGVLVWAPAAAWRHVSEAGLLASAVCILLFAYAYGGWAYRRERGVVVGLTALAAVVVIGSRVMGLGAGVPRYLFDYQHFVYELPASRTLGPWAYRAPLLAAHTWAAVVLARKGWRAPDAWPRARGADRPAKLRTGARLLGVVFALGAVTPLIQAAEYGGAVPHGVSNTFNLLLLALSVIVYTTYAPEPTGLPFRLTAVSISVVAAVLTLGAGLVAENTGRAARTAHAEAAEQVRSLDERDELQAETLPPGVAYAIVRADDGRERLVTDRPDLSLAVLRADDRAGHRDGWVLPSAPAAPRTGPRWDAVRPGAPADWSRGALAPAERRFDAVAVAGAGRAYEVGVLHGDRRALVGGVVTPLLVLMALATALIWAGGRLLFGGSLLRPIARLREGIARIEAGDLDARIDVASNDEIGSLGLSFNRMAAALGRARDREAAAARAAAEAAALREVDEARSRFFANVSHEFRTPLTLTLGPLDDVLAGEYGPVPEEAAEPIGLARRSAGRVLDLINQILDVSRLESGHTSLRARRLDLGAFADAQAEAFVPLAAHRRISVDVVSPAAPVEVWADPGHLGTVLANLLSNALKFTPGGGTVSVEVSTDGGDAHVVVRDTGPGIAEADLPHVFDRFYQAEGAAGRPLGSGIGLALAHELAALHGGTLGAESAVGGPDGGPSGSAFTLALPLGRGHLTPEQIDPSPWEGATVVPAPEAEEKPPAAAPIPDDEDVTTVLVADDQADIRAFVRRHLEGAGYRVVEAADGEEALDRVRQRLPDLVVSDVMMPRLDGLGLCRALRSDPETDFVPVLLLTARAAPEDRLDGLAEACDDYLTKPFDVRELVARVDNLIAIRRRLRERFAGPSGDGAAGSAPPIESADDAFVASVRAAIEAGLADEAFGVGALAEAVGLSPSHLRRRTAELVGASPSDLIRTARLDRAADLLAARAGTVSEVAYGVGFKSVAHFSNAFLAHTGSRPSAYAEAAG